MKRDFSGVYLALFLVVGCIIFRLFNSMFPEAVPNISPLMAVSLIGAMYLPRAWGWLVGPIAFVLTDLAFLRVNYLTSGTGAVFSSWTLLSLVIFGLAGGLGVVLARNKSLGRVIAGSLLCSLAFYVASNTFAWWGSVPSPVSPGYAQTLGGWWQANTVGIPGYVPTWTFLRNGALGDLFFAAVLLLVLDRALLFGQSSSGAKSEARVA